MAKNKTVPTSDDVDVFLNTVADEKKRKDCYSMMEALKTLTGLEPHMWGPSIVGFGSYHYKYESGHEGDAPIVGFSPRKEAIVVYLLPEFEGRAALLSQLGKYKAGKSCIYIKKLEDINVAILKEMVEASIKDLKKLYPST